MTPSWKVGLKLDLDTTIKIFWIFRKCADLLSVYDTKFFISLLQRAFKMMKNGVYFIVIADLVAELFKILVYAN